jgi:hypothetical protein
MRRFALALCLALTPLAACGSNHDDGYAGAGVVGAACSHNSDCAERCVGGKDYPGGMCTVSCSRDDQCPAGTMCIDDSGGICAVGCAGNPDCDGFGPGWSCKNRKRKGASGDVGVCHG